MGYFHKDNSHKPLSKWWGYIILSGCVKGRSDYYIAINEDEKKSYIS